VLLTVHRDAVAARRFFTRALPTLNVILNEVDTDVAPVYPSVLAELVPAAWHHVEQYANNPIEADHGKPKHRPRPMRGLQTDRTAQVEIASHTSYRICAAATTNSGTTRAPHCGSPRRSPNSPWQSDSAWREIHASANPQRNNATLTLTNERSAAAAFLSVLP
jgi:hypothetical protein